MKIIHFSMCIIVFWGLKFFLTNHIVKHKICTVAKLYNDSALIINYHIKHLVLFLVYFWACNQNKCIWKTIKKLVVPKYLVNFYWISLGQVGILLLTMGILFGSYKNCWEKFCRMFCFDSKVLRKCVTHKTKKGLCAIFMYLRKVKTYAWSRFYW